MQNAAAQVTLGLSQCDHVRPAMKELHWLPVAHRIQYKVALLMFMVHDCYIVEIDQVFTKLRKIKLNKSVSPDGICHKILKEMAYYLAALLAAIINSSLHQGIAPLTRVRLNLCAIQIL